MKMDLLFIFIYLYYENILFPRNNNYIKKEGIFMFEEKITDVEVVGNVTNFRFGRNRCSLESAIFDKDEGYILKYRGIVVEWGIVDGQPFKIFPPTFIGKRRFINAFKKQFGHDLDKISKEYPGE